jgi:hypothetical protein
MFLVFVLCHSGRAVNACAVLYRLDVGIVGSRTVRDMNAFFSVLCPVCGAEGGWRRSPVQRINQMPINRNWKQRKCEAMSRTGLYALLKKNIY